MLRTGKSVTTIIDLQKLVLALLLNLANSQRGLVDFSKKQKPFKARSNYF